MVASSRFFHAGVLATAVIAGSWTGGALAEERTLSTEYETVTLKRVADGLNHPWSLAFLPEGGYLVTEREGQLNHISEDGEVTAIEGTPEVSAQNQGGLLDVVLHPDYEDNGWLYLTYSREADGGDTVAALARARLGEGELEDMEELFTQDRASSPGRHYGSRLAWKADGTLLMSIGDRGTHPERAQATDDHAGTLLRMTEDGGVPDDNPFVGNDDYLPEIYSYGHRNIQGLIVHPETDEIWATEHGPRGGDELNLIEAGGNYGWPVAGKGRDYSTEEPFGEVRSHEEMKDPIYEFLPTHAPSGLALVTADRFEMWEGNLLAGGLRSERIRRVVLEDHTVIHEEELLLQEIGRIRDVREGPEGHVYVLNDESDAGLWRIE